MSGVTTKRLLTSPSTRKAFPARSTRKACCENDGCVAAVTYTQPVIMVRSIESGAGKGRRHTSRRMPFASLILTAPLWYISSWPITPSTCAGGLSLAASSAEGGMPAGAGGFVSAENETRLLLLLPAAAVPSFAAGASVAVPPGSECVDD